MINPKCSDALNEIFYLLFLLLSPVFIIVIGQLKFGVVLIGFLFTINYFIYSSNLLLSLLFILLLL